MEGRHLLRLAGVLALGLGLALALLWMLGGATTPVTAAPAASALAVPAERPLANGAGVTRFVAVTGTNTSDCTDSGNPCQTIQYAIDRPGDGDEIWVAGGTYTGVQVREELTQVVFISETVTIRGGYDTEFTTWDPDTYAATLDAEEQGRVVVVQAADITATLEALQLTNGSITGEGGGIYVQSGNVVISGCHIYSNTASGSGGGGFFATDYLLLTDNQIYANQAGFAGGGLWFTGGPVTVTGNDIYSNTAVYGGGVSTSADGGVFEGNHVFANRAINWGGGLRVSLADGATVTGNQIYSNTAAYGGGVYVNDSDGATLSGNDIYSNTSTAQVGGGGGVRVAGSQNVTLTGNTIFGNRAEGAGGGVALEQSSHNATLIDNEIYSNSARISGAGIFVRESQTATLTSNAIYSNTTDLGGSGGGGVFLWDAHGATLTGNEIHHNTTTGSGYGGGLQCYTSTNVTLASNQIHHNTSFLTGGGGLFNTCHRATLTGNDIAHNTSTWDSGGGLYLDASDDLTLAGNQVYSNTASTVGGISFRSCSDATLINTMVMDNQRSGSPASVGIFLSNSSVRMLHTTIARNGSSQDAGVGVQNSTAALTNTILVGHAEGIYVAPGTTVTLQATLWGTDTWANAQDWSGGGTIITGSINIWDDPAFVDPDNGNYHITGVSAARDVGVDTWVGDDIDGDPRPFGAGPDLGADEVSCLVRLNDDSTPYASIQAAVDASTLVTDVVKVAGTCRGVETRASSDQVAYISKTLTIRGGYSGDFSAWDPLVYPTTLDAQEQGRVIYINGTVPGSITPTLEGLRLTNGWSSSTAGGIYSRFADTVISGCQVYSNTATQGNGGGILLEYGPNVRLTGSRIYNNAARSGYGGGLYMYDGYSATLTGNEIANNEAKYGGGAILHNSDATLTNNIVADNEASDRGSGLYILNCSPHLLHNTIARNADGEGSGIYVTNTSGKHSTVVLTNTILVSHTVGITVTADSTATLEATLWGSGDWANDLPWGGSGQVFTSTDVFGNPAFVDPDSGDYHLGAWSAAIDKGLSTWVSTDVDGDPRSFGSAPDLGADEGLPELALTKSGSAWLNQGQPYTYTLTITNTGAVTATNVVLTDSLPTDTGFLWASDNGTVTVSSVVTWPTFIVTPGGSVVTRTFAVKASSAITNSDYRATAQGIPGVAGTVVVTNQYNTTVADAGSNQWLHSGVVTLDGSSSYDPEGHYPLEYHWWWTSGPTTVTLSNADTATATFTAPLVTGNYFFILRVTDGLGATDTDSIVVNIANASPVADAGPSQNIHTGTVTLDGSGSNDPDGDDITYGWTQTGGISVTLSNASAISSTFTAPLTVGVLTFRLTVSDTFSETNSATTAVTITNDPPVADAGAPQSVYPGDAVQLDGSASSDPDNDPITAYGWMQIGGTTVVLSGTTTVSPTFTAPPTPDVLTFRLTVTDAFGLSDDDTTTVTVALPDLTIAKSGPDEVDAGEPITYTLVVTNSGPVVASFLVITDALPAGASLIGASDGGERVDGVISWVVPSLGALDWLTRTFTVTATETLTNASYAVACAEGVSGVGSVSVVTKVVSERKVYLPLVLKN